MEVTGKKVLVFGSGISGIGAVKLLEDHGAEVILYDGNDKLDKVAMKEQLGDGVKAEIILGEFPEKLIDTLDIAVLSPGVPTDLPVVNAMRDKKVAVIGAGPAGITIAILLAKKGYGVTIFDSRDKIGGVLQYGIPAFRLPKSILERYKNKLREIGIKIRPNTTIGGALEIKDLFRDGYQSIFIGTGVWRPKTLGIKGESLGNVHFAIDYLANPDSYDLGDHVAIIGMGNSAMDVARTALRKGSRHVTLYARGLTSQASEHETAYAKLDGAELAFGWQPVEINDDGPVFKKVLFDEAGNQTGMDPTPVQVQADSVIISISQGPKSKLVNTTEGLKASANGLLVTNSFGETTHPGIFAAGDVVLGAKTVVQATAYAKQVAEAMDKYMRGELEVPEAEMSAAEVPAAKAPTADAPEQA